MACQQRQIIEQQRNEAEIFKGEAICKQKSRLLLDEMLLPRGLLPLDNIVEMGINRVTGFVWLRQRQKKVHRFNAIGRTVSFDTEVTAFVEEHVMRRITGVKTKELFVWLPVSTIFIDDPSSNKILFANSSGIARSFPLSAFNLQEDQTPQQHLRPQSTTNFF
ncbi:hypothetical protein MtrunA17_Chr2g0285991 [Medicago truncatula]|uniref:DUF538 family protein n=2 Tax=Medicago truncatula TaxID=3880 RepID=G7IPW3_MEDTR|nr:DUF538 family protein [Medicago truncatula]RHN72283.1 hypothetical protein MtrunA17_Chr2g0285991 [Medicago truncatula]